MRRMVLNDDEAAIVAAHAAQFVEGLNITDLHYLLTVTLHPRADGEGLPLLTCVHALRACAADADVVETPEGYERWRLSLPRPSDWPSAATILGQFERWTTAVSAAGEMVSPGRRSNQRHAVDGGFTNDALLAAVRGWIADDHDSDLTFEAYKTWAERRMRDDPIRDLPVSRPTFRKHFGTWDAAVDRAYPAAPEARARTAADETVFTDDELLTHVRAGAEGTELGGRVTRRAYDRWASDDAEKTGIAHPHSCTVQRRFGRWQKAVARSLPPP